MPVNLLDEELEVGRSTESGARKSSTISQH